MTHQKNGCFFEKQGIKEGVVCQIFFTKTSEYGIVRELFFVILSWFKSFNVKISL